MIINQFLTVGKDDERAPSIELFLDFFDSQGRYLSRFPLPNMTFLSSLDPDDNFYFAQLDPFPRVFRARLEIK